MDEIIFTKECEKHDWNHVITDDNLNDSKSISYYRLKHFAVKSEKNTKILAEFEEKNKK